jgi:hypothetical protein
VELAAEWSVAPMWPHATLIVYKSFIVAPAEPLRCAMLGGRGWVRTNDFCRVKRVRPPRITLRCLALHHTRPSERRCRPWRGGVA